MSEVVEMKDSHSYSNSYITGASKESIKTVLNLSITRVIFKSITKRNLGHKDGWRITSSMTA